MLLYLANLVAVVHGAIVASVVLGAAAAMLGLLRRRPRWERAYYALLALVIVANVLWGECPLTRWEQGLRNWDAPGTAYCNSFIGHYLPGLPPRTLAWLGPALMAGALLAAPLWRMTDRHGRRANGAKMTGVRRVRSTLSVERFSGTTFCVLMVLLTGCARQQNSTSAPGATSGPEGWDSDPLLAGRLGPEVQVAGYGIRPPAGYTLQQANMEAPDGGGSLCLWTGPAHGDGLTPFFELTVGTDNGVMSSRISSGDDVRMGWRKMAGNHSGMTYSPLEHGTVNGLAFSRGYWKGTGVKTGGRFHGLIYGRIASPSIITIDARDEEPSHRETLPLFEASALTLRKL